MPARRLQGESLVGREADTARLRHAATTSPLVTVCGPVGVGKTSLVEALMDESACPEAPWLVCALHDSSDLSSLWMRVGATLGAPADMSVAGGAAGVARLARPRTPLTLVLDGFDGLVECAAPELAEWLDSVDGLRVIVTSRERLGLLGEVVIELEPLSSAEAVELFDRCATATTSAWSVGKNEPILVDITDRLDRLPLAIALAAGRVDVLSPGQLLDAIERDHDALASGIKDGQASHRTLATAIRSALTGLNPPERTALVQACLFTGPFTLAAAREVIDPPEVAQVELLRQLRRKSLLRVLRADHAHVRYCVYETVRRLVRDEMSQGPEIEAATRRYIAYYSGLEDVAEPELAEVLAVARQTASDRPVDGLRAVVAAESCLWQLGRSAELMRLLQSYEETIADAATPVSVRVGALVARGRARRLAGDTALSQKDLQAAELLAGETPNGSTHAHALYQLGLLAVGRSLLVEAVEHLQASLDAFMAVGDRQGEAMALDALGGAVFPVSAVRARGYVLSALRICRELGDRETEAAALNHLGAIALEVGTLAEARLHTEAALAIHRDLGQIRFEAAAVQNLGEIAHEEGRFEEAMPLFSAAMSLFREANDLRGQSLTSLDWGVCCDEAEGVDAAEKHYATALSFARVKGDARLIGLALAYLGRIAACRGQVDSARSRFAEASEAFGAGEYPQAERILELCRDCANVLEEPPPCPENTTLGVRVAHRLLAARRKQATVFMALDRDARSLRVGDGDEISLRSRPTLWRVMLALCELRIAHPGTPIERSALFRAGWPDENISQKSAAGRVRSAVYGLRRLGLSRAISSSEEGYLIDPAVGVRVSEGASLPGS